MDNNNRFLLFPFCIGNIFEYVIQALHNCILCLMRESKKKGICNSIIRGRNTFNISLLFVETFIM